MAAEATNRDDSQARQPIRMHLILTWCLKQRSNVPTSWAGLAPAGGKPRALGEYSRCFAGHSWQEYIVPQRPKGNESSLIGAILGVLRGLVRTTPHTTAASHASALTPTKCLIPTGSESGPMFFGGLDVFGQSTV